MRGSSLSHPEVIQALRPYIVTSWTGRGEREMPPDVRELLRSTPIEHGCNIALIVLDPEGRVVEAFRPFPGHTPQSLGFDPERMGAYLRDRILGASSRLRLPQVDPPGGLRLPDVEGPGVRLFLTFRNEGRFHPTSGAPVVEAVSLTREEREALRRPEATRPLDAAALRRWLEQLYPPAVMDGPGGVKRVGGTLEVRPVDAATALLRGRVRLVLHDSDETEYEGTLEAVLTYRDGSADLASLRGVFEASIFRQDRPPGRRVHETRLLAAIESRPE
jgi:hypothetical protein